MLCVLHDAARTIRGSGTCRLAKAHGSVPPLLDGEELNVGKLLLVELRT